MPEYLEVYARQIEVLRQQLVADECEVLRIRGPRIDVIDPDRRRTV